MTTTIAVLSDIHGMLPALNRVLAEPAVQAAELIVVTGDHTWGPQPAEVLDRLIGLGDRAVLIRGNADRELLQMAQGMDVGLNDDPLSVWGAAQLSPAHLELLADMPEQLILDVQGFGSVLFCHATPRDDEEVVLVDSRLERWEQVLQEMPTEVQTIVCGHTHMPFMRLAANRLVINPGSVGLPYGRAGAHWALLDDGAVTFARTILDSNQLIEAVRSTSTFPQVTNWLEDAVRHPATDTDAIKAFGPRDGRPSQ
ncbi:metallophosphoesterase [Arthrobacter cheniae]|uniref:Metallophosphoesterase n=1 Tax=Arthrobacter cheniae TaxID=1258888 RepID=A0A3A5M6A5_9MICC|nr:metallophosphoesterase family protein [Arthrobacter cheniae]RJT80045.1 metallophosphoesterase [Arthrobacter cheniae]